MDPNKIARVCKGCGKDGIGQYYPACSNCLNNRGYRRPPDDPDLGITNIDSALLPTFKELSNYDKDYTSYIYLKENLNYDD